MKKVIKIIIISLILTSCQSAKDALTLKKKNNADEFLVEKKSPLAQPPEYGKLPLPDLGIDGNSPQKETKLKSLNVGNSSNSTTKIDKNSKSSSIEKSILEKIK
tara:strand:+ start:450 stop:761 length:312 start_codon:yes stop_codon:yes gene_type:complete